MNFRNLIRKSSGSLRAAADTMQSARARVAVWTLAGTTSLMSELAHAQTVTTKADFKNVTSLLQAFLDFMVGPFGKAVVIISIIAAFVTWVFAPKEGIFGPILRVVVAGIAIMNAAAWITQFGAAGSVTL
jgi:type IV secretory pathway VirB2 component (pilin)